MKKKTALDTRPQSVTIVALGPSNQDYIHAACGKKDFLRTDEVWLVNSSLNVINAEKCFIMDDLRKVAKRYPQWTSELQSTKVPIVTCRQYPEFPTSVAFPIEEVMKDIKDDYFTSTIAYMLGYAIYIKVDELYIFGADFWYPDSQAIESGLACLGYLLGIARERGVNFKIPGSSTLLDSHMVKFDKDKKPKRPMYGYDYNPGEANKRVQHAKKLGRDIASSLDKQVAGRLPKIDPNIVKNNGGKHVNAKGA
jgi:hypothetical protein